MLMVSRVMRICLVRVLAKFVLGALAAKNIDPVGVLRNRLVGPWQEGFGSNPPEVNQREAADLCKRQPRPHSGQSIGDLRSDPRRRLRHTIAIASVSSHDVIAGLRKGQELSDRSEVLVLRVAAILTSLAAIGLSILFQRENITFLIVTGLYVAASSTFPMLVLAIYRERFNGPPAVAAGTVGLVSSTALLILGPACWIKALGFDEPIFPSDYPALICLPLAFLAAHLTGNLTQRRADR